MVVLYPSEYLPDFITSVKRAPKLSDVFFFLAIVTRGGGGNGAAEDGEERGGVDESEHGQYGCERDVYRCVQDESVPTLTTACSACPNSIEEQQ